MGSKLAREVTDAWPLGGGSEWLLLLKLAWDADDGDRRTACGFDYMLAHTQAPKSTVNRWLKKLRDAGLLKTIQRSRSAGCNGGQGQRAVYEIQIMPSSVIRIGAETIEVSQLVRPDSALRSHKKGCHSEPIEVSLAVGPDYPDEPDRTLIEVSPAVRPPLQDPIGRAPVEGAWQRPDQNLSGEDEQEKNTHPERGARRAPAA